MELCFTLRNDGFRRFAKVCLFLHPTISWNDLPDAETMNDPERDKTLTAKR
jgi:hypothetical protein